jgi:hypothetical protein
MIRQVGLRKFKLSQSQYKGGAFYFSAIQDGDQIRALDGRFFIEDGGELKPTKKGFRIPIDQVDGFKKALCGDLRGLSEAVLFKYKSFRFHIRYVNDKYGEGIDFRKYATTDLYTGWDKAGIRIKIEDVVAMREWLTDFSPSKVATEEAELFILDAVRKESKSGAHSDIEKPHVSPDIEKLLNFDADDFVITSGSGAS